MLESQCKTMLQKAKANIKESFPYEDINLFSILNMENKEVEAHSAFLYYIFKPFVFDKKKYDANLRMLLKALLNKSGRQYIEPEYIDISREVATDFGRLDFLINYSINGKDEYFIVELKIWAGEQENQIKRYENYLETICTSENIKNRIFFLTPDKREAETGNAINITLKEDIYNLLDVIKISKSEEGYQRYCTVIEQYQSIIEKLTGETFMKNQELFKNVDDIKASQIILKAKDDTVTELLHEFMLSLKDSISKNGNFIKLNQYVIEIEDSNLFEKSNYKSYYRWGTASYPVIPILLDKEKLKPDIKNQIGKETAVYFFVEIESNLYSGITLRSMSNNNIVSSEISKELRQTLSKYDNKAGKTTSCFFRWEWIKYENNKINFSDYLDNNEGFLRLLKNDSLEFDEEKIKWIANEIVTILSDEIKTYFC